MSWHWENDLDVGRKRLADEKGETVMEAVGGPEAALRVRSDADSILITLAPEMGQVIRELLTTSGGSDALRSIVRKLDCGRRTP